MSAYGLTRVFVLTLDRNGVGAVEDVPLVEVVVEVVALGLSRLVCSRSSTTVEDSCDAAAP